MNPTVLSVAFPFAPVGPDAVGGAEQVLSAIDHALVQAGWRSLVIACAGSRTAGHLEAVPAVEGPLDDEARRAAAWTRQRHAIERVLARTPVDVVHMHGIDFAAYLPRPGPPVLVTLHLPPSWYAAESLAPQRSKTWFNPVSQAQHAACPNMKNLLPPIANGVPIEALKARHARRRFALMLGRICPEKGVHLAIEAAKRAGIALLIGGEIFPYPAHQSYFAETVAPRLDARRRTIGPVGFSRKRRLLNAAQCVLIPSLAPETSSLVAREAIACGTPVVAFANGALAETIEHGRTGFLVANAAEMAEAIPATRALDPEICRSVARKSFPIERMTAQYLSLYRALAAGEPDLALSGAA